MAKIKVPWVYYGRVFKSPDKYVGMVYNEKGLLDIIYNIAIFCDINNFKSFYEHILEKDFKTHVEEGSSHTDPIYHIFVDKEKYIKYVEPNLSDVKTIQYISTPSIQKDKVTQKFTSYLDKPVIGSVIRWKENSRLYKVKKTTYSKFVGWYQFIPSDLLNKRDDIGCFGYHLTPYNVFIQENEEENILTAVNNIDFQLVIR